MNINEKFANSKIFQMLKEKQAESKPKTLTPEQKEAIKNKLSEATKNIKAAIQAKNSSENK